MRVHSKIARMLLPPIIAFAYTACASVESPQEKGAPVAVVTTPAATAVVTVPSELTTLHPGFVTAWQGTDPAALKVYFADDAMVMTPAGHFMGWTDIQTKWITPALPNMSKYVLTPTAFTKEGNVIVETGNLAYVLTKDGQPQNITGMYTHRWQLQSDGTWRLVSIQIK
jgi:ketosteroid isomerase-like protein